MKLQIALDRISIDQALELTQLVEEYVDIIEVGTSLIKDFGLESVRAIKSAFPDHLILADIKTIDEGAYEFRAAFQAGADIATVMAASSMETLEACYQVATEFGRQMLIDVLEERSEKIHRLETFHNAIFCIHSSTDRSNTNIVKQLREFKIEHPNLKQLAIAGGIKLEDIKSLKQEGIETVIIGSAITKSGQPNESAKVFHGQLS